ncbi:hypothetical protein C1646_768217 [Rhizophagus diaphanus]|nr:hypothetical protein C1646_768217 [Rhizophagus diaphanus] [Rhizophagus sp. MUCL 43196]
MKQQKKLDEYTNHEEVVQTDNEPTKEELKEYDEVNTVCSTRLPENEEEKNVQKKRAKTGKDKQNFKEIYKCSLVLVYI